MILVATGEGGGTVFVCSHGDFRLERFLLSFSLRDQFFCFYLYSFCFDIIHRAVFVCPYNNFRLERSPLNFSLRDQSLGRYLYSV